MTLQLPRAPASPEVIRHHVALHAQTHDLSAERMPCTVQRCPHDAVHVMLCAVCDDPLFLFTRATSTCGCDVLAARWIDSLE